MHPGLAASSSMMTNSLREGPTAAKALKDCSQVLGTAADRTKDSMAELKKLKKGANETESRWYLSNVMTWTIAALANEETCTDGLKEAKGSGGSTVAVDVGAELVLPRSTRAMHSHLLTSSLIINILNSALLSAEFLSIH